MVRFKIKNMIFLIFAIGFFMIVCNEPALCEAGADAPTIQTANKEGIGSYLTDSKGMTLYFFKKDSLGKSNCKGACLEKWPIFYTEKVIVPSGLKSEDFGLITREDGKKQTTFKGWPLYYWVTDKKAGDTYGQGVNDVWFVVNPSTFKP